MTKNEGRFVPGDNENSEHLRVGLPAIVPSHDITDTPTRCYVFNTDYIGFLCAGIDSYVHTDAFVGSVGEREEAAQRFVRLQVLLMTGNLACGETDQMMLRQNPNDACQLQQSHDNGASWTLAFDYRLCISATAKVDVIATANASASALAMAEAHLDVWVGDYHEIAPSMHYDLGDDDVKRDQAYCFAVQLLLLQLSAALSEFEGERWEGWDIIEVVAAVTDVATSLLLAVVKSGALSVHPLIYSGVVVANAAAFVVGNVLDLYSPGGEMGDEIGPDVQGGLLCCGVESLGGMTPDFNRFSQMFAGCDLVDLDPFVAAFLEDVLAKQEVYLAFLGVVEAAFTALDTGQVFNCPCEYDTYTFEFTTESGDEPNTFYGLSGWTGDTGNAGCFNYVPEGGIFWGDETTGDWTNYRGVNTKLAGVTGEINSVEIIGNQVMGSAEGVGVACIIAYGGDQRHWAHEENNAGDPAGYKRDAYRQLVDAQIDVQMSTDTRTGDTPVFTGTCMIARIIIRGRNLAFP